MRVPEWTRKAARKAGLIYAGLLLWWSVEILAGFYLEVPLIEPNLSSILVGLLVYLGLTVVVVGTEEWVRGVLPGVWRWAMVGLLAGLIVIKLELVHPLALTAVLVLLAGLLGLLKAVSAEGAAGTSAGLMWMLALSPDWSLVLPSGALPEVLAGVGAVLLMIAVLRALQGLRSRSWIPHGTVRPVVVCAVLVVVVTSGYFWTRTGAPDAPKDYFSGTVPDVRLPADRTLAEMPNIILISVDTLRADAVPPHAEKSLELPALRTLQDDSVRYSQMISTSSWTLPSHASLFTGLLPMEHGAVKDRRSRIYASVPSYVQQLRRLGYRTGAFTGGGWIDPEFGFGRGFRRFWKNQDESNRRSRIFHPGFLSFEDGSRKTDWTRDECLRRRAERFLRHFCVNVQEAKRWIQDGRDSSQPFFLFLHTFRVHDYGRAYPKDVRRLKREHPGLARALFQDRPEFDVFRRPLSDTSTRIFRQRFSEMDGEFQTVFQRLDRVPLRFRRALKHWIGMLPSSSWEMLKVLSPARKKELLYRFALVGRAVKERPVPLTLRRTSLPLILASPQNRLEGHLRILRERADYTEGHIETLRKLTRRQMEGRRHLYRYGLERMDRSLEDFLQFLRFNDLYEDSVILFISDHGEGFSLDPLVIGHGRRDLLDHRGQLHDVLIRVPFWMKLPGSERSNQTVTDPRQIFEVFPLLFRKMGVTGYRPHGHPFGTDPGSDGPPLPGRNLVVSSVSEMDGGGRLTPQYAVRSERYKLVRHWNSGLSRFFRLPEESGDKERSVPPNEVPEEERARLQEHMDRLLEHYRSLPDPYRDREFRKSPEIRRTLRGLGYMQ